MLVLTLAANALMLQNWLYARLNHARCTFKNDAEQLRRHIYFVAWHSRRRFVPSAVLFRCRSVRRVCSIGDETYRRCPLMVPTRDVMTRIVSCEQQVRWDVEKHVGSLELSHSFTTKVDALALPLRWKNYSYCCHCKDENDRTSLSDVQSPACTRCLPLCIDCAACSKSKLTRRQSVIEGRKLALEARQLKYIPVILIFHRL